jgi:cytochrome P450
VGASIALAHRSESAYPAAAEFRPERFLERRFSPHEFLPFGGGTHRCLGAAMATYEMKVVLATLLRSARFRLLTRGAVKPTRKGVLLGPHDAVVLEVQAPPTRTVVPEAIARETQRLAGRNRG